MSSEQTASQSDAQVEEPTVVDAAEAEAEVTAEVVELTQEQRRIEELESEIETMGHTLRSYAERVDRMRAEFDASKARIQREHERAIVGDKVKAVTGLLGVLDDLDQALANTGDADGAFVSGVQLIQKDFAAVLVGLGLERFDPTGEPFDPERHEALTVMPVPDAAQHNTVVHVMKQGALMDDKVVRAATVVVGKHAGGGEPVN